MFCFVVGIFYQSTYSSHFSSNCLQVANFEYIDEAKALAAKEEEARKKAEAEAANSDRAIFWDKLLKDRYDVQKVEEHTTMGKGKRSRKQVTSPICYPH